MMTHAHTQPVDDDPEYVHDATDDQATEEQLPPAHDGPVPADVGDKDSADAKAAQS